MKSHGALALLLITAGGLIYAATHQPRDTMQTDRRNAEATVRMASAHPVPHDVGMPYFAAEALAGQIDRRLDRTMGAGPAQGRTPRFICKLPAEVGPVPLLEAVDAWLRAAPDSRGDPALLRNLQRAARQGNWLAKVQVYLSRNGARAPDDATAFGTLTLMDWMGEYHIGALYATVGKALGASGQRRAGGDRALSSLDFYAAMHHNYPSQYKVGRALLRSGDAQQAAMGRRMLDCAARALPVYGEMAGEGALAARG